MVLRPDALVCALDDALHRGLVEPEHLEELVRGCTGRPGARALADGVARADGRAESPAETLRRLVLAPVLPGLVPQVVVRDEQGLPVARLDLGDRTLRLGVEADGQRGHAGAT